MDSEPEYDVQRAREKTRPAGLASEPAGFRCSADRRPSHGSAAREGPRVDVEHAVTAEARLVVPAAGRLRVLIADDDPLASRVIKDALRLAGIVVVAVAQDGREAVELCRYYVPDIVLMDVVMPRLDGIGATREIARDMPDQLIVLLTSADEGEIGLLALRAGAAGFLSKDIDLDSLPQTLRGVIGGEGAVSRRMTKRLVDHLRRTPDGAPGLRPVKSSLTAREWEVLDLLHDQQTTDEMADALVVTRETVRSHVKNILRKLGATSRAEAVEAARRIRGGPNGEGSGRRS
jgi:NarL family two-component system response regulator LiaR